MEGWKKQEYWNGEFKGTVRLEWRVGRNMNIGTESLKEQEDRNEEFQRYRKIGMVGWKEQEYWNGEFKGTVRLDRRVGRNRKIGMKS